MVEQQLRGWAAHRHTVSPWDDGGRGRPAIIQQDFATLCQLVFPTCPKSKKHSERINIYFAINKVREGGLP